MVAQILLFPVLCEQTAMTSFPYDLNHPDNSYSLQIHTNFVIIPLEGNNRWPLSRTKQFRSIFDLASATITELAKHGDGDSEDLAVIGTTAYVLKSGKQPGIYQVCDFQSDHALFEQYDLALTRNKTQKAYAMTPVGIDY